MNRHWSVLLPLLLLTAGTRAETNNWTIAKPWPDNPLKTATLQGSGLTDHSTGNAWLNLSCRGDAPEAAATLKVDATLAAAFPTARFEGPGAAGEKSRQLSARLGGEKPQRGWYSTGSVQENSTFEWAFQPQKAELKHWLGAPMEKLTFYIKTPGKAAQQLVISFTLPESMQNARQAMTACLK